MLAKGNIGNQDQLAAIMMAGNDGNADEFLFIGFFIQETGKDFAGRQYGRIGTSYKGRFI